MALNATIGKTLWSYDPHSDISANEYLACHGVAYYAAPAPSGSPCDHGTVSLTDLMGEMPPGFHFITSQPLVVNNRMVLGGWIYDNQARGEPSGVVRAYDPQIGRLAWAWDMGHPDPTAPLKLGDTYTRGTPNGWGTYTAVAGDPHIAYPAFDGIIDWYGASIDPARHVLIANTRYILITTEGMPTAEALRRGLMKPWAGWGSKQPYPKPKEFAVGLQCGTPYAAVVSPG